MTAMKAETPQLSPRELEVMQRIAKGMTDYAIGQDLDISEHTVDNHIRRVFDKLGVHSRSEAIARLLLVVEDKRQLHLSL